MKRHPLVEVAEFVRAHAMTSKVAVIFDLDSTLFNVSPRTQTILRRLGRDPAFMEKFAREAEILRDVEVLPTDWGVREVLSRTSIQPSLELFESIRLYWRTHFFSSHDLHEDHIYPSANEYVRHLESLGARILYLTGRWENEMREGTVAALKAWGFPYGGDEVLLMKPSEVETDEGFKAGVLKELAKKFDHIWFFENEPVIINEIRGLLPQVKIVFVNSTHSRKGSPPADLPAIGMSYSEGLHKKD